MKWHWQGASDWPDDALLTSFINSLWTTKYRNDNNSIVKINYSVFETRVGNEGRRYYTKNKVYTLRFIVKIHFRIHAFK